ncbi:hypothetical protein BGZ93_001886 [Podila epicladia]|nr:hypothetical protein BGZ92_003670 [Podila epicladia]KAG0083377.1 hypothetical protein BGZ93_001886 [Podila epicladia]
MTSVYGPLCVASNGNTLYAVATSGLGESEAIILVKSNTAPGSLAAVSWTTVATTLQKTLTTISGHSMSKEVVCHVDNRGVFTLMSLFSKSRVAGAALPSGYQYDPATKAWTNIAVSAGYKWGDAAGKALFTVDGSSSTLMHIYLADPLQFHNRGSNIAVYNPTTHIMTEGITPWIVKDTVQHFAGANGTAYIVSVDIMTNLIYLNIGAVGPTGAPPASTKTVQLDVGTCSGYGFRSAIREGTCYLLCSDATSTTYRWFTYDGTSLSASSPTMTDVRSTSFGFLPLGPAGSPATWAFMYDVLGVYGVTLTGPQAGQWQTVPYKFNISDPVPSPGSGTGSDSSGSGTGSGSGSGSGSGVTGGGEKGNLGSGEGSGSGGLSTGALAGIIGGVAVVLCVAIFAIWRRKKSALSKPGQLEQQSHNEPPQQRILKPMEKHQREDPYPQKEDPYLQNEDPYPKPTSPVVPTVFVPQDAARHYPSPEVAVSVPRIHPSPTAFSPQTLSPGTPSSLSPQSFTNSTLADSEIASIAGSPYHHAAGQAYSNPQQYPQPQNPKTIPIFDQKDPHMYASAATVQDYGEAGQARPAPSQANAPALQLYPAVTAPQFYGESSPAHAPPSPAHVAMASPQDYGQPSQA